MPRVTVSKPELMPGGNDVRFRQFIHDFLAFSARVDQCRSFFGQQLGISGVAYTTLISIAHLEGEEGVGVSRIAEHLHLSGAFVTIEVAKLVKAGFVKKRTNASDRRRVLLTLTPKGQKMLDELAAILAPVNDALFDCLSAEDFIKISTIMTRLVSCGDHAVAMLAYMSASPPKAARKTSATRPRRARMPAGGR